MFFLTQEALEYMKEGSVIINTTSITAFDGNPSLLDYSSTKGACQAFTRALSKNLASKKIRVNAVAPGPIWTPFISSSFGKDLGEQAVKDFGKNTLLGRPGQPEEVAPAYVFLASQDSTYFTGQTLHPNGGK
jgi:NAD(P)-dependent dehydrogenase (short-subunit alcohol dehydrogenase family)